MKKILVLLSLLAVIGLLQAASGKVLVKPFPTLFVPRPLFPDLEFSKGENDFDVVKIKDCALTDVVGAPQLPVKYMHFLIPPGKDVVSIKINKKSYKLPGQYKIMPVQPPCYLSENWKPQPFVWPDDRYYKNNKAYPAKIAEVVHHGYFDGSKRIVTIAVHPLQYQSSKNVLIYHDKLSFKFKYRDSGPDDQPIQVRYRKPELQAKYDALLNSLIDNNARWQLYYDPPDSTGTETQPEVMDYLIIAPEEYLNPDGHYLDAFVDWKKAKGLNVSLKSWQSIVAEHPEGDQVAGDNGIVDAAGSIRQYLKEQYQQGLVYALLVGDDSVFPIRYGCATTDNYLPPPSDPDRYGYIVPADLYFAEFNGKWNTDGDEYYGEPNVWDHPAWGDYPDYFCEIFVGRILVPSIDKGGDRQLANWMEKLIAYEMNPGNGDNGYLTRALYTSSDQMVNIDYINNQLSLLMNKGWWVKDIKESPASGELGTPTGDNIVSEYNQGYGLTSFNNHGDVHTIAVSTTGTNDYPKHWVFSLDEYQGSTEVHENGNGLDNLLANEKYSVNLSTSCDIGAYDWEADRNAYCMARAFTTLLPGKGGPAMIANTRWGTAWTASIFKNMLRVIYGQVTNFYQQYPVNNIGIALAGGKHVSYGSLESYSLNLFGDPEMSIWTEKPKQMVLTYSPGLPYVTVKDSRSGAMLQGTKVHFWNEITGDTDLVATSSDGKATCTFGKFTHVSATRDNYLPVVKEMTSTSGDREQLMDIMYHISN